MKLLVTKTDHPGDLRFTCDDAPDSPVHCGWNVRQCHLHFGGFGRHVLSRELIELDYAPSHIQHCLDQVVHSIKPFLFKKK